MKLCCDCKWFLEPDKCVKWALVDGHTVIESYKYNAFSNREDGFFSSIIMGSCGKRGRWFEKKDGE